MENNLEIPQREAVRILFFLNRSRFLKPSFYWRESLSVYLMLPGFIRVRYGKMMQSSLRILKIHHKDGTRNIVA